MSRKEKENNIPRHAVIEEIIRVDENGAEALGSVSGTDREIVEEAVSLLEEERGRKLTRLTPDQARMTKNRFCFSSSTWNAPWQPTGPKSPGKPRLN